MEIDSAPPASLAFDDPNEQDDTISSVNLDSQLDGSFSPDRRPKKSSSTCTTCRARKVRCNGSRPVCSNCQRLGFPCSYDDADSNAWSVALPRRRVKQACLSCHSRKAKCSGHMPACERCRTQGIECIYRPSRRSRISARLPGERSPQSDPEQRDDGHNDSDPALSDPASLGTPGQYTHDIPCPDDSFDALVGRTFDKFFRHVHHIPMYSFLHRASLMEQYNAGKVDKALLLALIGITSALTDMGPGMREYGDRCIDDAESLILADYTRPSTIKIQALVFMVKHRILCNKFPSAFILISIASRYATAMRLNYENPSLCFLAQESRRRLMWSLYCMDLTISGGLRDYSLWRPETIQCLLPCNERNFEFDLPQPTEKLILDSNEPRPPEAEDIGSLALHIRILYIRQKIIEFTKGALVNRNMHTGNLQTRVLELHQELDHFSNHLPASFQFSENNLRLRAYSPRICVFVMIHLWWRQCHCDLYRLALVGLPDALPRSTLENFDGSFIEHCQRQCFDHSVAMANIFSAMQKLGAKPVADLDFAICAYQCARMLTYAYHTNAGKYGLTTEVVLEQAHACQKAIKQCCMGPAAASIRTDLEKLIAQGLSNRSAPARNSGSVKKSRNNNKSQGVSRQSALRNMEMTGERNTSVRPNTPDQNGKTVSPSGQPTSGTPVTVNNPPVPDSMMAELWGAENFSADVLPPSTDMQGARGTKRTSPSEDATNSAGGDQMPIDAPMTADDQANNLTTSELNNAYDAPAFETIGMENGLDLAIGMDLNMWAPNSSGSDWMGGTEFVNGGSGVGV